MHIVSSPQAVWRDRDQAPSAQTGPCNLRSIGRHRRAWEGFGGCFNELGWDVLSRLNHGARKEILDGLFGQEGLHLDIGRLPMGASDYALSWHSYDETEDDIELKNFSIARDREKLFPYVNEALERRTDLRFFASPWSPPTWMKFPAAYNYGTLRREPGILKAYADYFMKYVEACLAEGIRIADVHPQNEPVADQKFPSCVWTGEELEEFIGHHLGPAMAHRFPKVGVWLGTMNTSDYDKMFLPVLSDPDCRKHLRGVGIQWDGKNVAHQLAASCPELPIWQTENECGDGTNSWAHARYVFRLLSHYVSAGASAYVYWNMALAPGGRSTWGWNQNSLVVIDPEAQTWCWQPEFYVLKHVCQFVRPGDFPLQLQGTMAPCSLAFERAQGGVVVVVSNPSDKRLPLDAEISGREIHINLEPCSFNTFLL